MKRLLLSSVIRSFELHDEAARRPVTYHVWTNSGGTNLWDQGANWHNGQVPGPTSNVLLADYQHNCVSSGVISPIKSFTIRPTFNQVFSVEAGQSLLVSGSIAFTGPAFVNIGRANIVTQYGDFICDSDGGVIFWANGKVHVSGGNAIFRDQDIGTITGFVAMYGSGTLNANVRLPGLRIYGDITLTGYNNAFTYTELIVSGHFHIPSGNQFTITSNKGKVQVFGSGSELTGDGVLVLERGAQFISQQGELDCREFIIQDYDHVVALLPNTYNARKIIFRDSDGSSDAVVFDSGNYVFNGPVEFRSWNTGNLEIHNDMYSPNITFNKDVTLTGTNLSQVTWNRGDGIITLGKPTGIAREFTKFTEGRGAFNRSDDTIGMAVSRVTLHANLPILWIKNSTNDMTPLTLRSANPDFHQRGFFTLTNATGTQLADIAIGIRPGGTGSHIYIGDIADSGCLRGGTGVIFRVGEPTPFNVGGLSTGTFEKFNVAFTGAPFGETGGLARDIRAIMVGTGGDIYCVTYKTSVPQLFKIPGEHSYTGINTWRYVANLGIDSGVVAADIAYDGSAAVIKTYHKLYYYTRDFNNTIDFMLTGTTPVEILDYNPEWREESMAFGSGANYIYMLGQYNQDLHSSALRSPARVYKKHETISFNSQLTERIVVSAPNHTKVFPVDMLARSFAVDYGSIHLSGNALTTEGDFYMGPGGDFDYRGLPSSVLNIGGDYLLVGSQARPISLINYTGQPYAYTNVSGTATVYWANVGRNNASGGSTVYAYFSNNHSGNVNWSFAPIGASQGIRYLYVHQDDGIDVDNTFPMFMAGIQDRFTGGVYISISGSEINPMGNQLQLYISGDGGISASFPMYMAQSGLASSFPLFLKGTGIEDNSTLFLYIGQSGALAEDFPLYVGGHIAVPTGLPVLVVGHSLASSGINMYLSGLGKVGNSGPGFRVYSHGRHSSN